MLKDLDKDEKVLMSSTFENTVKNASTVILNENEIFEKIIQRIEKSSSLEDEYMVSVTEIIKADVASTS